MEQSRRGWQYVHVIFMFTVTLVFQTRGYRASEGLRLQQAALSDEKEKFTLKYVNK